MLLVPGGPFTMGADTGGQEDEHPAHTVTLAAFFLDKTEVTNAAVGRVRRRRALPARSSDASARSTPTSTARTSPVSGISWDDAQATARGAASGLPREAEFEKAVRDTDDRRFAWGNDAPTHDRTVFSAAQHRGRGHAPRRPRTVRPRRPRRQRLGVDGGRVRPLRLPARRPRAEGTPGTLRRDHGRAGRAAAAETSRGSPGSTPSPTECEHSIRGGAYNYDAHGLRATNRVHHPGRYRIPMLGLRCAKDAPAQ